MMIKIGIVLGSTRPGRKSETVGHWVLEHARARTDAAFEIVDIAHYKLPLLDEPVPASMNQYQNAHTKAWAERIATLDGYIFVTPEYNHGPSGALKNAIDFVYKEWNNKAAGFVGYGAVGAVRAIEQLRVVLAECQIATVRAQVGLSLFTDFENFTTFRPGAHQGAAVAALLDQVVAWARALQPLRT
jgi:NAD(P)H-dependent FMN reductase